jgi:outer membrane protein W
MNMSLRCGLALAVALSASPARAEGYLYSPYAHRPTLTTAGWELAVPVMDLRSKFIDAMSTTGLGLGMRYELGTQLSAGADVAWNRFEQNSALGDHFRFDAVSLRGTLHYYFTGSEIQPYAGIGAGGLYREAVLNTGPTQTGFGLCAGPELGLLLTFSQGLALNVAARYEFTTTSFDVNGNPAFNVKFPSWVAVQVGLAIY